MNKQYDDYFIGINGSSSITDEFTDDGYRIFASAIGEPYLHHTFLICLLDQDILFVRQTDSRFIKGSSQ